MAVRIEFKVKSVKLIGKHNVQRRMWMSEGQAYMCGELKENVWRIEDTDGHIKVWQTLKQVKVGDTIRASIKYTKQFNGISVAYITRGTKLASE